MVMFHNYPLGGDTAAPSELYARLCYVFLVTARRYAKRGICRHRVPVCVCLCVCVCVALRYCIKTAKRRIT